MRVTYALQGLLTASTVIAASYNPRYIVLGTDGTVVVDADPSLYFRTGVSHFFEDHDQLEDVVACDLVSKQPEVDEVSMVLLPSIDNDLLTVHDITSDQVHFDMPAIWWSWSSYVVVFYCRIPTKMISPALRLQYVQISHSYSGSYI